MYATLLWTSLLFPIIDKPLVAYRFYCMTLFQYQTRRHMITPFLAFLFFRIYLIIKTIHIHVKVHRRLTLYSFRIPPSNVPDSFQVITKDKPTSLCTCMGDPHCIPLDNSPTNVPDFNIRRLWSAQR